MNTPTLFDPATPGHRTDDANTSVDAAQPARYTDRLRALTLHRRYPDGLTDFELAALMNRQQTSAGKRRGELRDLGYVTDSGQRRPAPSGARAIVWQITDAGRAT